MTPANNNFTQCYLLYGGNEVEINNAKLKLIDSILPQEERVEGVAEFVPATGKLLSLSSVGSQIMGELSSLSLLSDCHRIAIVYDLENFFSGKKFKPEIEEYFISFLQKELPGTNNVVIFINIEDFDKDRNIAKTGKLFKTISEIGSVQEFKEIPVIWQLEPVILQRNSSETIKIFREWLKKDRDAPRKLFSLLVKIVGILLQLEYYEERKGDIYKTPGLEDALFPAKIANNFKKLSPFVLKRYNNSKHLFSRKKLMWANNRLLEINKAVFPQSSDLYVPDIIDILELFMLKFLSVEGD